MNQSSLQIMAAAMAGSAFAILLSLAASLTGSDPASAILLTVSLPSAVSLALMRINTREGRLTKREDWQVHGMFWLGGVPFALGLFRFLYTINGLLLAIAFYVSRLVALLLSLWWLKPMVERQRKEAKGKQD